MSKTGAWRPLALVAAAEVALAAAGLFPRWPGLAHGVALPPFDLAFDLRLLVARSPSYAAFAAGGLASVMLRSAVLAALLGGRASFRHRLLRAFGFYVSVWAPLAAAAALEYAAMAAVYHWYLWAGLGLLLATAVPAAAILLRRRVRLRRVLSYLGALSALGAAAKVLEPWSAVAMVPVSALLTARVLGGHPGGRRPARPRLAAAALLVAGGVVSTARAAGGDAEPVLFLVPGVDTTSGHGVLYRLDPRTIGFGCDRVFYFSYLGPGAGAPRGEAPCPIRIHRPYRGRDTQAPVAEVVEAFGRQLEEIGAAAAGRPVVVVTHSQGAQIAWRAVSQGRAPGVSRLVMLAAFPRNPGPYPAAGRDGVGRVGGDALRALSAWWRRIGVSTFDPDAPLPRETLGTPGALERIFGEPFPPGVVALAVSATLDAPLLAQGRVPPGARDGGTVDATHVGLVTAPATAGRIRRFLAEGEGGRPTPLALLLAALAPSFAPPPAGG